MNSLYNVPARNVTVSLRCINRRAEDKHVESIPQGVSQPDKHCSRQNERCWKQGLKM